MALTLEQLRKLADAGGLHYFLAPDRPALMLSMTGFCGRHQLVMSLELDGRFLQFRSISYLHCTSDHRHLLPVLKLLGGMNYRSRLVKFGWDAEDGEIVVYADMWLMDASLTQEQFGRILENFASVADISHRRISQTMETGKDPGEMDPASLVKQLAASSSLPEPLRKLLDSLAKKGKKKEPAKTGPEIREI